MDSTQNNHTHKTEKTKPISTPFREKKRKLHITGRKKRQKQKTQIISQKKEEKRNSYLVGRASGKRQNDRFLPEPLSTPTIIFTTLDTADVNRCALIPHVAPCSALYPAHRFPFPSQITHDKLFVSARQLGPTLLQSLKHS